VINHAWKDNDLMVNICSCNEEMTTLFDNVNINANGNNIKNEQKK
jgi:hypothetical protein